MIRIASLLIPLALLTIGCASSAWDGTVDRWGTLRQVLRDGDVSGKVRLESVCTPFTHGIGALAGLEGEIAIQRGFPFVSRATSPDGSIARSSIASGTAAGDDEAAFLVVTEVYAWRETRSKHLLDESGLKAWIEIEISGTEVSFAPVVPVRVEGVMEWKGHVLAGHCPRSKQPLRPGTSQPIPAAGRPVNDTVLIGFFTTLPPGEISHHGTAFHLHALDLDTGVVAHVDEFTIGAGARLFLPAIEGPTSSSSQ